MHSGIDFMADSGIAIHSAAGGKVTFSGDHTQYGRLIEIDHGNGLVTRQGDCMKETTKDVVTMKSFKTRGQHTQCPTKRAARAC